MAVIYLCPTDKRLSCSWEGSASEIQQHFEKEHTHLLSFSNDVEIDLESRENRLLSLNGEIYLMQTLVHDDKLTIKLRYLGSPEDASRIHYQLIISVENETYSHESHSKLSCIVPSPEGWEVSLDCLENFHGKLQHLTCTLTIDSFIVRRSSTLKIDNPVVEEFDKTEEAMLSDLHILEKKLEQLKDKDNKQKEWRQSAGEDVMSSIGDLYQEHRISNVEIPIPLEELSFIPHEINLACCTCGLDMLPPIYVCVNGHNVCTVCTNLPCKYCQGQVTTTRNRELEAISRDHLHQCRYHTEGCNEKLRYEDVRAHEGKCLFCKYGCMLCPFQGKFDHFTHHVKVVHSSIKIGLTPKNDFPKNAELYVIDRALGIFYCKSEVSGDFIIWKATYCGTSQRQFFCEISFKGSKYKEPISLKKKGTKEYEVRKPMSELKKNKAKEKYAVLNITNYDH